jgi:hypothetical protein
MISLVLHRLFSQNPDFPGLKVRMFIAYLFNRLFDPIAHTLHSRKLVLRSLVLNSSSKYYTDLLNNQGYSYLSPDSLDQLQETIDHCHEHYTSYIADSSFRPSTISNKAFMVDILPPLNSSKHPLISTLNSLDLFLAVSSYFQCVPIISSIRLFLSKPHSCIKDSQLFHLDHSSSPLLKLLIPIGVCNIDNGPFTFLDRLDSEALQRYLNYGYPFVKYRVSDRSINSCPEQPIAHTLLNSPPSQSILLIDTSACFHYGSRNMINSRLMLMVSFNYPVRTDFKGQSPNISSNLLTYLKYNQCPLSKYLEYMM